MLRMTAGRLELLVAITAAPAHPHRVNGSAAHLSLGEIGAADFRNCYRVLTASSPTGEFPRPPRRACRPPHPPCQGRRLHRRPNRCRFRAARTPSLAACRTPGNPWDTQASPCVESVCDCQVFSLVRPLPSPTSAADCLALFGWLIGTTERSDSSTSFMRAVRLLPSPAGLVSFSLPANAEVSRFSCMQFLSVLGVYDYAGPPTRSRFRHWACCLPLLSTESAPRISFTKLNTRPTDASVYASPAASRRRTQDSRSGWFATPFL